MWKCSKHVCQLLDAASHVARGVVRSASVVQCRSLHTFKIHTDNPRPTIHIQGEVRRALERHQPVVALESTIITHGMPFPHNLKTAREVEELVRENGATPATIAIIDGRIKVGLDAADLNRLAATPPAQVIKCSRRDLPYVIARRYSGGTTVAATMLIAHAAGIKVFATGGIGGVHRDGHITMDVSADLVELGRTPVAVVCSGVKSILDIPRTLEYLETFGVCVASYGSPDCQFPDFYTRDSGSKAPYNLNGPIEAAQLIASLHALELQSGILIGVPIPEEFAADKRTIEAAIDRAHVEASMAGVSGKQITPFLLSAISKLTGGESLQANMALIKNNAIVAAQIAHELEGERVQRLTDDKAAKVTCPDNRSVPPLAPLIIGASILDLSLTMTDDLPQELDGATYNTRAKQSPGGVGRNLAEGIFKLNGNAHFISAVGDDQLGRSLVQLMPEPLRDGIIVDAERATSLCSLIFDRQGDCKLLLGNMDIHEHITPHAVRANEQLLRGAPLIIMDGNLSTASMECILQLAQRHQRPVLFEPTDMRIAAKPFRLPRTLTRQIKLLTPNLYELRSIVEALSKAPTFEKNGKGLKEESALNIAAPTDRVLQWATDMLTRIEADFDCVLVTLGHHGLLLMLHTPLDRPLYDVTIGEYIMPAPGSPYTLHFFPAPQVTDIRNVSGAGDSFTSGFTAGLLRGYDARRCVALGFIAAERALQSESAVPCQYFANKSEETKELQEMMNVLSSSTI